MTSYAVGFKNGKREAGKVSNVDFVGRKPTGGVHGVVVGRKDARQK